MIQLGRALWPRYASHLQPHQVRASMKTIAERLTISLEDARSLEESKTKIEDEFVRLLGTRFHAQLAALSKQHEFTSVGLNERGDIFSTFAEID